MNFAGFVGPSYTTRLLQTSMEECLNLFPEKLESPNAKPPWILRGTPGLSVAVTGMTGRIRGQFQQDGRSFAVDSGDASTAAHLWETTTGTPVSLGTVASDTNRAYLETNGSQNGAGGHQLICLSAGHGYIYDLNAGTFAEIAASGWPPATAIGVTYFDGYFLVLTPTFVGQSTLEDGTAWNASNRGARSIATDNNVAFINNYPQHTLWVFGSKRTEVWYDNAGATFSFGPIPGVFVNVGCAAAASVQRFNDTVVWLGTDEAGTATVFLAVGYNAQRISTLAVEADLALCASVSDFVGWVYSEEGHTFYVLSSVANQRTWVYDAKEQLWHKRGYFVGSTGLTQQVRGWNHIISPGGAHWVGDWETGTIYQQSLTTYSDNGNPIRALRRFPHLTADGHRIFYPGLSLFAAQGLGLSTGQGSDPTVQLSWSDDGGNTFGPELPRSLGKQGAYGNRTYWQRLGVGRNRVFQLSMTDPVPRAWLSVTLDPDPVVGAN
jgi:hypothetical protein